MKMKYIIIPTIVFNLVCLSIFISRQYKKYHTRKSNYIHYIETIKAKIESEFGKYYSHPGSNPVNVCFVNYDLPTKRIDDGERFDYFGFEEDQNYNEIREEQVTSKNLKIKKMILS